MLAATDVLLLLQSALLLNKQPHAQERELPHHLALAILWSMFYPPSNFMFKQFL